MEQFAQAVRDLDVAFTLFLNGFSRQNIAFDEFVAFLVNEPFLRNGVIVTILWWAWFRRGLSPQGISDSLEEIVRTLAGAFAAVVLARGMQNFLPERLRPLHATSHPFQEPHGITDAMNAGWSSFPSDTSTLALALTTAVFMLSRKAGVVAFLYAALLICLPRTYTGHHYLSDIVAGALLGTACMLAAFKLPLPRLVMAPVHGVFRWSAAAFMMMLFIATTQMAMEFRAARKLASGLANLVAGDFGTPPDQVAERRAVDQGGGRRQGP